MLRRNTWTAVPVLTVFALTACGGGGGEKASDNPPAQTEGPAAAAPAAVENAATLNVSVAFSGTPPARKTIDMSEEKVCADKHTAAGGPKSEDAIFHFFSVTAKCGSLGAEGRMLTSLPQVQGSPQPPVPPFL